jgi:hypothetical protein
MDMSAIGVELMQRRAITSYRWQEVAQMNRTTLSQLAKDVTSVVKTRCQMNLF